MRVAVHVVVDCLNYKRVVVPKIERLEQVKGELQAKISEVEAELAGSRGTLEPAREGMELLEREYQDLHRQVTEETAKQETAKLVLSRTLRICRPFRLTTP